MTNFKYKTECKVLTRRILTNTIFLTRPQSSSVFIHKLNSEKTKGKELS